MRSWKKKKKKMKKKKRMKRGMKMKIPTPVTPQHLQWSPSRYQCRRLPCPRDSQHLVKAQAEAQA